MIAKALTEATRQRQERPHLRRDNGVQVGYVFMSTAVVTHLNHLRVPERAAHRGAHRSPYACLPQGHSRCECQATYAQPVATGYTTDRLLRIWIVPYNKELLMDAHF